MLASVKALLAAIVDYAGLFPPAKLDLAAAITHYAQIQTTPQAWMLGHFVLPAARLNEFAAHVPASSQPWSLSLVFSKDAEAELEQVRSCRFGGDDQTSNPAIVVNALEFPPLPPATIQALLAQLPAGLDAFFELPWGCDLDPYLAVLQGTGAAAKIRTGGITAEAFPSRQQLCQVILAFAQAQVPFKATAGLHHPLPGRHPLTYKPDSPTAMMHGFLNVALLAALAHQHRISLDEGLVLLQESTIASFHFTSDGITWGDRCLTLADLENARRQFFRSFGSCSFQEPIVDLQELALL